MFSWSVGNKPGRGMVDHWVMIQKIMIMKIIKMMILLSLNYKNDDIYLLKYSRSGMTCSRSARTAKLGEN